MSINVLWIVGTALAASSEDPGVVAATDGQRVWLTVDAGERWRRIADFGPGAGEDCDGGAGDTAVTGASDTSLADTPDDDDDDDDASDRVGAEALDVLAGMNCPLAPGSETRVRALAIKGATLYEATIGGLYTQPISGGPPVRLARDRFVTLAVSDGMLWATTDNALLRSDDGGRRFRALLRLPDGVHGLAVHEKRVLLATDEDVYQLDPTTGRSRALEVGLSAVAASDDGSFWRAAPDGIFRSRDGGATWTRHAAHGARALAVSAGDVWIATGGRVGRAGDLRGASLAAAALPYRFYDDVARPDAAALAAAALARGDDAAAARGDDAAAPGEGSTAAEDAGANAPARASVWLPIVSARARLVDRASSVVATGVYGWDGGDNEAVFEVTLQWQLDGEDRP